MIELTLGSLDAQIDIQVPNEPIQKLKRARRKRCDEMALRAKQQLKERQSAPDNIWGVDVSRKSPDFKDYRNISYQ
jgi:hypothetical protein